MHAVGLNEVISKHGNGPTEAGPLRVTYGSYALRDWLWFEARRPARMRVLTRTPAWLWFAASLPARTLVFTFIVPSVG